MWVEDPGFPLIRPVITQEGITLAPIPVDADGLNVAAGMRDCPQGRFALVTPAHQSPLGVALSLTRRRQLLAWAANVQARLLKMTTTANFVITVNRFRRSRVWMPRSE